MRRQLRVLQWKLWHAYICEMLFGSATRQACTSPAGTGFTTESLPKKCVAVFQAALVSP